MRGSFLKSPRRSSPSEDIPPDVASRESRMSTLLLKGHAPPGDKGKTRTRTRTLTLFVTSTSTLDSCSRTYVRGRCCVAGTVVRAAQQLSMAGCW